MANPTHQITPCALPHLPLRARPRLDHHGFREQGSKVAEERVKKLGAKIKSLRETEERLNEEKETLWAKANKDLMEANRMKKDLDGMANDADNEIPRRAADAIRDTRKALRQLLDEHDGREQKRFRAEDRDNMKAKRKMRLKKKELAAEMEKLTADLQQLALQKPKESNDGSHRSREPMSSSHPGEDGKDKPRIESDGVRSRANEWKGYQDVQEETHKSDVSKEKTPAGEGKCETDQEAPPQANGLGERPHEQARFHQEGRATPEQVKRIQRRARKSKANSEKGGKEVVDLTEKISRFQKHIRKLDERIQDVAVQSKIGEKEREEALQSEDELPKDHKVKIQEEEKREREEDDAWDRREKRLQNLRQDVVDEQYKSARSRQHRRVGHYRRAAVLEHFYRDSLYTAEYHRNLGWEIEMVGPGSSDDEDDEYDDDKKRKSTERRERFGRLEISIMDALNLQRHIQALQEHLLKLKGVVHLKEILEKEKWLEDQWLKQLKEPKRSDDSEDDDSDIRTRSHHFAGKAVAEGIYKKLEKGQFRVLVLRPAPESYYPLICSLETWPTQNLDDVASVGGNTANAYAALSYFWGSETCNGRIYLLRPDEALGSDDASEWGSAARSATRIRIRNNLFRALLRLRSHGPEARPVALWVDFMCINQKDAKEKTDQLGRMVNVYRNASNVCIWLGEGDSKGRSDEAMEFISTIMDFAVLDRHAHDKRQAKKWYALGELMRDRWFSRRWVVQEIALARDATVHCGGAIVRWSDFADAASLLVSNQETIKSLFDFSEWREGRNTLGDVDSFGASILLEATNKLFRRKPNGDIKWPLKSIESLVTSLQTFDAGDPRDLIYSVISIAKDTSENLWSDPHHEVDASENLTVDYSLSAAVVYKDFAKFCILSSNSLDIICRPWAMPLRDKRGGKIRIPSWIQLLSRSEFGVPEEVYSGRKNGESLVGRAGSPNYQASGNEPCKVRFRPGSLAKDERASLSDSEQSSTDQAHNSDQEFARELERKDDILVAHGFRLAEISEVSPRNTGGVILRESLEMGGWRRFKHDTDSVPDPIWRTLVADRDEYGQVPPSWYQRACLRCLEIADTFNNGDLNVGELLQGHSEMLRKYLLRMRNVTWNRRFFTAAVHELETGETDAESCNDESEEILLDAECLEDGLPAPEHPQSREDANLTESAGRHTEKGEPTVEQEKEREGSESGDKSKVEATNLNMGDKVLVNAEKQVEEDKQEREGGLTETGKEDTDKETENREDIDEDFGKKDVEKKESVGGSTEEKVHEEVESEGDKEKDHVEIDIKGKRDNKGGLEEEDHSKREANRDGGKRDREVEAETDGDGNGKSNGESGGERMEKNVTEAESEIEKGPENESDGEGEVQSLGENESSNSGSKGDGAIGDQTTLFRLCPPRTRRGDLICILHGCSVPVILRRESSGGYMKLIGEAYVHGKMDGEAVEDFGGNDTRTGEEFRIR